MQKKNSICSQEKTAVIQLNQSQVLSDLNIKISNEKLL